MVVIVSAGMGEYVGYDWVVIAYWMYGNTSSYYVAYTNIMNMSAMNISDTQPKHTALHPLILMFVVCTYIIDHALQL